MREIRPSGSEEGAVSNHRPYSNSASGQALSQEDWQTGMSHMTWALLRDRTLISWRVLVSVAAMTALAAPVAAQLSSVLGRVIDQVSRAPIPGVAVRLLTGGRTVLTNDAGYFAAHGLEPGLHVFETNVLGYVARQDMIQLRPNEELEVEIRLSQEAIVLEGLVATVRSGAVSSWLASKGFPQRREQGFALSHLTQRDVTLQSARTLAELIEQVPGARIRNRADAGSELWIEPSPLPDGRPCRVGTYLNGSEVELGRFNWTGISHRQRSSRPLRFSDLLQLDEIDGLELYGPADSPIASDKYCGALLLWSDFYRTQVDEPFTGAVQGVLVREETNTPVAGARITLLPIGLSALTDSQGKFTFPEVVPGTYQLTVETADLPLWRGAVEVKAYGTVTLMLRVEG